MRAKRYSAYPRRRTRFWVNLQTNARVTRKPLNLRMGKGKGGLRGLRARVTPGAWLVAFTSLRAGLLNHLFLYTRVRFPFLITLKRGVATRKTWVLLRSRQKNYRSLYYYEGADLYRQARQPQNLVALRAIFRWYWRVPRVAPRLWRRTGFTTRKLGRRYSFYLHRRAHTGFMRHKGLCYFVSKERTLLSMRVAWLRFSDVQAAPLSLLEQASFTSLQAASFVAQRFATLWLIYPITCYRHVTGASSAVTVAALRTVVMLWWATLVPCFRLIKVERFFRF